MRKFFTGLSVLTLTVALSGCSAFYPNWGATGLPEEPEVVEQTLEPETSAEPTETASEAPAEESSGDSTEEPTAEPEVQRVQTSVDIIMAIAEPDFGVLTIVAQIPGIAEAGGTCTMRFIGSDTEASMEVKAEPSSDYTQCFPIEYPLDQLPSGNGIVTVSYESDLHFGVSTASSVVIP